MNDEIAGNIRNTNSPNIEQWRRHHNHIRPDSSLDYLTPVTLDKQAL